MGDISIASATRTRKLKIFVVNMDKLNGLVRRGDFMACISKRETYMLNIRYIHYVAFRDDKFIVHTVDDKFHCDSINFLRRKCVNTVKSSG